MENLLEDIGEDYPRNNRRRFNLQNDRFFKRYKYLMFITTVLFYTLIVLEIVHLIHFRILMRVLSKCKGFFINYDLVDLFIIISIICFFDYNKQKIIGKKVKKNRIKQQRKDIIQLIVLIFIFILGVIIIFGRSSLSQICNNDIVLNEFGYYYNYIQKAFLFILNPLLIICSVYRIKLIRRGYIFQYK